MGRSLRQYDKEYMKIAMLNQEQTFREQVNELHRLYRVQKLLMRDVTSAAEAHTRHISPRDRRRRPAAPALFDLELPATADEEDADVELTLATGDWSTSTGKKADSSESGASFSSSASAESGSGTASGSGSGSGGESLDVRDWGLWCRTPVVEDGQGPVAVAVRQGMAPDQRPQSWQMQYLTLNMT